MWQLEAVVASDAVPPLRAAVFAMDGSRVFLSGMNVLRPLNQAHRALRTSDGTADRCLACHAKSVLVCRSGQPTVYALRDRCGLSEVGALQGVLGANDPGRFVTTLGC